MGALRASWQVAFRAESAARAGKHYAQALLDLVKAFDKVPHCHVVNAAKRHGFNLWVLRMSLLTYRIPKVYRHRWHICQACCCHPQHHRVFLLCRH